MKDRILSVLKNADGYVSGEDLSKNLGITRSAVWKHISQLKEEGYTDKTIERKVKVVRSFYRRSGITLIEITRSLDINPECRKNIENSEIFKEFANTLNLDFGLVKNFIK